MAAVVRNVSISPVSSQCLSRHGPIESAQGGGEGRGETGGKKREGGERGGGGEGRWWREERLRRNVVLCAGRGSYN